MTRFRMISLAVVLGASSLLGACTTAPAMPMGTAPASGMHSPDAMTKMDAHMKTMRAMHEKMMTASTAEERNALMAAHMKTMKDGMAMMKGMHGAQGMQGMQGAAGSPQHAMMGKQMEMMQSMMEMMMDRMPAGPAK